MPITPPRPESPPISDNPTNTGLPPLGSGMDPSLREKSPKLDAADKQVAASSLLELSNLNRTVFDKNKFNETVDTSFSELGDTVQPDPSFFDLDLATQSDFWILYDKFFYEIPKEGDTNSHEYLAKTSGDYVNFERDQTAIQELLEEISQLRIENLDLRTDAVSLEVEAATANAALAASV